jgi:hypothetical protein
MKARLHDHAVFACLVTFRFHLERGSAVAVATLAPPKLEICDRLMGAPQAFRNRGAAFVPARR